MATILLAQLQPELKEVFRDCATDCSGSKHRFQLINHLVNNSPVVTGVSSIVSRSLKVIRSTGCQVL